MMRINMIKKNQISLRYLLGPIPYLVAKLGVRVLEALYDDLPSVRSDRVLNVATDRLLTGYGTAKLSIQRFSRTSCDQRMLFRRFRLHSCSVTYSSSFSLFSLFSCDSLHELWMQGPLIWLFFILIFIRKTHFRLCIMLGTVSCSLQHFFSPIFFVFFLFFLFSTISQNHCNHCVPSR